MFADDDARLPGTSSTITRHQVEELAVWAFKTFKTAEITERLLEPDRETLLSYNDYHASVSHFSNTWARLAPNRFSLAASLLVLPVAFLRKWPNQRTIWASTGSFMAGRVAGAQVSYSAHRKYIDSLDNPESVGIALRNAKKRMEVLSLPQIPGVEDGRDYTQQRWGDATPVSSDPIQETSALTGSTWDQIRARNSTKGRNSAWDDVRQTHERQQRRETLGHAQPRSESETDQKRWSD